MERIGFVFSDRPHMRDYSRLGPLAEDLGYDSVWVSEPRMARDAVTGMAVLADVTKRLKLGTAVLNNWTRGPGLMAATFAALNELAPGRVILGIGAYWDPLAYNQGIDRKKPLTAMREYVEVVRRLWRLERVTFEGEVVVVRNLEMDMAHGDQLAYKEVFGKAGIDVPIYLGATGERMLELTGKIADGAVLNAAFSPDYVRFAVECIRRGAESAGRDLSEIDMPKMVYVAVDRGPESWLAVKRKITRYLGQQPHVQKFSGLSEDQIKAITEAIGSWPPKPGGIEEAMKLVPDETVMSLVAFGSPKECQEQILEFVEAGASCPILMTEQDDVEQALREFAPSEW